MLPNGFKKYKSLSGTILTLVTFIFVLTYAVFKWQTLIEQEEIHLFESRQVDYFFDNDDFAIFSSEDGFNVAFGLADQDENIIDIDPSYGYLQVFNLESANKVKKKPSFSRCKDEEFPA